MRRYIGSLNFGKEKKSPRQCYCISLKEWEVHKEWFEHLRLAKNERREMHNYGYELFEPPHVGIIRKKRELDRRTDFTVDNNIDEIFDKYGWEYNDI